MRLPDEEVARIERRVGTPEDALVVRNLIESLVAHVTRTTTAKTETPRLRYEVVDVDATRFDFVLTRGFVIFAADYVDVLRNARRSRIFDVRLEPRGVVITIARASYTSVVDVPPYVARVRERRVDIDFAAGGVTSADDRTTISAIVTAVYSAVDPLPASMVFWYETIGEVDDESMSEAPVGDGVLGYSIVFGRVPSLGAALLEHVRTMHAAAVAGMYMWYEPPPRVFASPIFVVNVRAASTPVAATKLLVHAYLPRGIAPKK